MEKTPIYIPTICPVCGAKLVKNGPFLECSNKNCPEIQIHRIMKWINVHGIMNLSTATLNKLMSAGLVSKISDLYKLTLDSVQGIDGIGLGFQRVIDEINRSKNPSLANFLAGFDMDGIGRKIWEPIIDKLKLKSISDILSIQSEDLINIPGIGETRAIMILENLIELHDELLETEKIVGISQPVEKQYINGKLSGKSFCITGSLNSMKRSEAELLIISKGGTISSVKKGLFALITNDTNSGTSKNKKAAELGIQIINENQFLEMIK